MLSKKSFLYIFAVCTVVPILCYAESFLTAAKFPKTFEDLSFQSRLELEQEDALLFKDLTPYQILQIIETDIEMVKEIEEIDAEYDANNDINYDESTTTYQQSQYNEYTQSCSLRNPDIPINQQLPIGKPVLASDYVIGSRYGWRKMSGKDDFHHGVDIGGALRYFGKPVFTPADGTVLLVQRARPGSAAGNYIRIRHANGFITKYMHLNTILVKPGQTVQAGCQIGTIGHTGGSKLSANPSLPKSASHLHYEIHYSGKQNSIRVNGKNIKIEHGRNKYPQAVKDDSIDPKPFLE